MSEISLPCTGDKPCQFHYQFLEMSLDIRMVQDVLFKQFGSESGHSYIMTTSEIWPFAMPVFML